ncbi:hypothetical protein NDU88_003002 [Pleurodeles waltl]|uniref:Uncharacterized protein n=1 Tax=Pleurodeles waltl TaxID=8319 RepID=A0AAV7P8A9_PLEWA|nr:hypothetical protein NDU88_003002 [Pleurodeles waltl]
MTRRLIEKLAKCTMTRSFQDDTCYYARKPLASTYVMELIDDKQGIQTSPDGLQKPCYPSIPSSTASNADELSAYLETIQLLWLDPAQHLYLDSPLWWRRWPKSYMDFPVTKHQAGLGSLPPSIMNMPLS